VILITGITGLTGKFLYRELKTKLPTQKIKYLVRETSDVSWMDGNDELVTGDLYEQEDVTSALQGCDSVLHLAPRSVLPHVIKGCELNKIHRIFYVNSTGIYSQFKSSSHADKKNEVLLKESGLTYTIVRPTMIYGNEQDGNMHMLIKIMKRTPLYPVLGKGHGLMHPIYAQDLAKCLVEVLRKEKITRNKEYNVAGFEPLRYRDILTKIASALDKKVRFIHIPYGLALFAGKIGDKIPNPLITHEKVLRLNEDKHFDYSLAKDELNFSPISFEEGIRLEVEELRKNNII
jgi:nucleoside-diphosphate-sugar epimerase